MSDSDKNTYTPPEKSKSILKRQNDPKALRLLIAQRRAYSIAKRWLAFRVAGVFVIAIMGPILTILYPSIALPVAAISGAWIALGRTALQWIENRVVTIAASIQEQFDFYVYGMPASLKRRSSSIDKYIALAAKTDSEILKKSKKEEIFDWYEGIDGDLPGVYGVALSQKTNAFYSSSLLKTAICVSIFSIVLWTISLVIFCSLREIPMGVFIVGALLPLLPAYLDIVDFLKGVAMSDRGYSNLSISISKKLDESSEAVTSQNLLVWQENLFNLRSRLPIVPDWLYKFKRKENEGAAGVSNQLLSRAIMEKLK